MADENPDVTEQQLKNLKRRIVAFIWQCDLIEIVKISLIVGIKIPKQLIEKYILSSKN